MGQATSSALAHKSNVFYDYDDFSSRFSKVALTTATVPVVVIAFPILNAYTFTKDEMTGFKMLDGIIGGLFGVIGWPLSPFIACWNAFQAIFNDGPPEPLPIPQEVKEHLKKYYGLNSESFYNVAVVGMAGTGKSSLINGMMGCHDGDPRAAKTGEIDTTNKPKGYQHPDLHTMILWDMPGAGTYENSAKTYFEEKFLYAFDTLIIVSAERMLETDLEIARKAREYRIPFVFVRNKADQAIQSKLRKNPAVTGGSEEEDLKAWAVAAGELVEEVRTSVWAQLKASHISTRTLFIVSAWNLQSFVCMLDQQDKNDGKKVRLIDEERFIRRVVEGVLYKRRRTEKAKRREQKAVKN
ncbi:interferon-inducible GTPase-domain-containing protein [Zychaea mexicana]|uniref:interferon-inducible GTPase-domain-containing protein n=1 Tax=Zychaea mexicana TaxID=64656 RepID=UPI0022FE160B|nr:interferon-inducible GTPase-domain-containing protein [Zychaea mexicana]KAI9490096.1 interferon-inducible GTPase-domain-containing protein [Zychaea mexicana]